MANPYSTMAASLVTVIGTLVTGYPGLVVKAKLFKPNDLPDFDRYAVIVSPNVMPWDERRTGIPQVQYILKADLFLLVKNFHEEDSLFGVAATALGIFEMINDVKTLLRLSDLGGLIPAGVKSYDEPAGPLTFESGATGGLESAEKAFVHRARLVYTARMAPFCHPRLP